MVFGYEENPRAILQGRRTGVAARGWGSCSLTAEDVGPQLLSRHFAIGCFLNGGATINGHILSLAPVVNNLGGNPKRVGKFLQAAGSLNGLFQGTHIRHLNTALTECQRRV